MPVINIGHGIKCLTCWFVPFIKLNYLLTKLLPLTQALLLQNG